jgi:hypothetical protein
VLHVIRDEADQLFGTTCVAVNVGAVLIPSVWLMR